MPVLMLIAIAVVLAGIFFAATGRGGELAYEHADHAPLDLGPVSAADIALLRPPSAMWGYNMQVTDAALDQIARAMRERDVTIAYLQDQLANVQHNGSYSEPRGAHARPVPGSPLDPDELDADGLAPATDPDMPALPRDPEARQAPEEPHELFMWQEAPEAPEPLESLELREDEPLEGEPREDEPLEAGPPEAGPPVAADSPAATQPAHLRTPLVLKASGSKPPPAPEPHEVTQPSEVQGPQGSFDTHDWWAQQKEAAQQERARRRAAGEPEEPPEEAVTQDDDPLAAAEEQGW